MQGVWGCDDDTASGGGGGQYQGGLVVWLGKREKVGVDWYLTKVK